MFSSKLFRAINFTITLLAVGSLHAIEPNSELKVDYDRNIRPILSDKCFKCHGPDSNQRQAGLRLDNRDGAIGKLDSGAVAIVPNQPDASELVRRIYSSGDEQMPPAKEQRQLTDAEKQLLRTWVEQGANYRTHWSLVAPQRASLPSIRDTAWPKNEIDHFILARLEATGLRPSSEANRESLIRRVTLDLTGLPPTIAEIEAFLGDRSSDAYEKVVDRLLQSVHHGERMALDWLDAARYADTHGYHIDSGRDMTRWREWVIQAFHKNMPFDQFTIEQMAGDLLPNPTLDQQIASGFNRNHMINFEGGAIPEEYLTAYIIDRVNTTSTVWLGLTLHCTQCHDHKYDPFTQKDFYQLFAFFNNVPESGLDGSKGNAMPFVKAPTSEQQAELERLAAEIKAVEEKLSAPDLVLDAAQKEWEKKLSATKPTWQTLRADELVSAGGASLLQGDDHAIRATGTNPAVETYTIRSTLRGSRITALRLEALPDLELAGHGPGRSSNGNVVLTNLTLSVGPGAEAKPVAWKKAAADFSQKDFQVEKAIDSDLKSGWALYPEVGKPHHATFYLGEPISIPEAGVPVTVVLDFQSQFGQHQFGRFRLSVTDSDSPDPPTMPVEVNLALAITADQRSESQLKLLRSHFRHHHSADAKPLVAKLASLTGRQTELDTLIPTAMVMRELPKPRDTFLLVRGQYDKKGDQVQPKVPAALPPLPAEAPATRLGLAQWLVHPSHPLTARVTVNRYWQMFFGVGLVKTSEDFGSQGELPSHPELLDWLAIEFQSPTRPSARPWDIRALIKNIVTSATYRQSSRVTPVLLEKDPENRLLARGTRYRLQAEFIRDEALAISGLLDRRIGGKSVFPYQPPGLWEELMSREDGKNWTAQTYTPSHGADLYRRSMYTFWKRTSPPPTMATFDAPDREVCSVRRGTTNTPLQALILMNDPTFVESARKFAERILVEGGQTTDERIAWAFRSATARLPTQREAAILRSIYDRQLQRFRSDQAAVEKLLKVGESPVASQSDRSELAAWATVANAILNLDETITKS